MAGYRTPLGRARGLGSAKHGVGHFIAQRASAVALILLVLWAIESVLGLAHADYEAAVAWAHAPVNAVLAALLIGTGCFHMKLGMQTIIEDYIIGHNAKSALLLLNLFACWLIGAIGVFSILKVAFSGGAY